MHTVTNDYEQPDGAISCAGVSCPPKSSVFSCSGSKALFSLVKAKVESNDPAFTLDLRNVKKFDSSLAYPSVKPQVVSELLYYVHSRTVIAHPIPSLQIQ
jgi:hypothetical protein